MSSARRSRCAPFDLRKTMNSEKIDGLAAFTPHPTTQPSVNISSGLKFEEPLIFERSQPGRKGLCLHADDWDVPEVRIDDARDAALARTGPRHSREGSGREVRIPRSSRRQGTRTMTNRHCSRAPVRIQPYHPQLSDLRQL